ncbi:MAG: (2Fe-2S)-binding protein [Bosea sp. (in: a-proteobacteria)]|uniref:(2Fe-2S)-binding protein n=1 Tax=unclassified Bosea (in: a-proteobacteria) TaxID=2653178 RepID=UPI00095A1FE7|nr:MULTISPECIES: (2Fe-2S)-binding protein [unclassified Bosea (in: a-proteobacteria)]MBN9443513.1 (2Fe-2S)-binding protein [Bosea sp. (in: a-proteobacteria)]MBN9458415.1 (2Fe-2S)-binding protein [Bosea sp. (in: a-proteobacteria)]OJV06878.1 MAG: ferredoxin [Bosea sp. 67-29]
MSSHLFWNGVPIAFEPGETIAAALLRAGIVDLGRPDDGPGGRVFCGIGACQGCVVTVAGAAPVEACLTPARDGLRLGPLPWIGADHG